MSKFKVDFELIQKYNVPGPRYTSYPPAPQFTDRVTWTDVPYIFIFRFANRSAGIAVAPPSSRRNGKKARFTSNTWTRKWRR